MFRSLSLLWIVGSGLYNPNQCLIFVFGEISTITNRLGDFNWKIVHRVLHAALSLRLSIYRDALGTFVYVFIWLEVTSGKEIDDKKLHRNARKLSSRIKNIFGKNKAPLPFLD